jgi:hypothetical protein
MYSDSGIKEAISKAAQRPQRPERGHPKSNQSVLPPKWDFKCTREIENEKTEREKARLLRIETMGILPAHYRDLIEELAANYGKMAAKMREHQNSLSDDSD